MALKQCPKCYGRVSDKAPKCPTCSWVVNVEELLEQGTVKPVEVGKGVIDNSNIDAVVEDTKTQPTIEFALENESPVEEKVNSFEEPIVIEEPIIEEPVVVEEPIIEEPIIEEPVIEEPIIEEPIVIEESVFVENTDVSQQHGLSVEERAVEEKAIVVKSVETEHCIEKEYVLSENEKVFIYKGGVEVQEDYEEDEDIVPRKRGTINIFNIILVVVLIFLCVQSFVLYSSIKGIRNEFNTFKSDISTLSAEIAEVKEQKTVVVTENKTKEDKKVKDKAKEEEKTTEIVETVVEETVDTESIIGSSAESLDNNTIALSNGMLIDTSYVNQRDGRYKFKNAKIIDVDDDYLEISFILDCQAVSEFFSSIDIQCLDKDGFEIATFYIDAPKVTGEFTASSSRVPVETVKMQIKSQ